MKLTALRCTNKFKQNGGVGMTVIFHSADKQSMALFVMAPVEADKFKEGTFYDFEVTPQQKAKSA